MLEESAVDLDTFSEAQLEQMLAKKKQKRQSNIQAYKELREEVVPIVVKELIDLRNYMSETKASTFEKLRTLLEMKADVFADKKTGEKAKTGQQTHTFRTDEGDYSVQVGYRINDGWDDTVTMGIRKIEEVIQSMATDEKSASLVKVIFDLLKKDHKGNLRSSSVLRLENMKDEFNSSVFNEGVEIIRAAYKPVRSRWFIEATFKDDSGKEVNIETSLSGVEFPAWFSFDMFEEKK